MAGGWQKRSGGDRDFFKFQNPGDTLVGKWRGHKAGKYGENGLVKKKDGEVAEFTLNTALQDLVELEENTPVKIVYIGKQTSKAGNQFKAFDIFTWDAGKDGDDPVSDFAEPTEPDSDGDDDEVPF